MPNAIVFSHEKDGEVAIEKKRDRAGKDGLNKADGKSWMLLSSGCSYVRVA